MTERLPRLRPDVKLSSQGASAVIMDPARRSFFRLGEVERFIVEQLDGEMTVDELLARVERRFDGEMPRDALERFLTSLERQGLLDSGRAPTPRRPRRVRGNLFYLRFPLGDPNLLLAWLEKRLGFLYAPATVALCGALVLTAVAIAVVDWRDVVHDAGRLYRLSAIPEIWLTAWSVVAAHEFAHGLTCKRYGGDVHEMGLLLIYLQPAAYCDVSDAWMFRDVRQRVLVTLAGPWFELCLWALATVTWRVTDPETWINELALIVVATSGIKTLLNLNPFLKFDGYYVLSDLLGIPNLRRRAFLSVGDAIRTLFGTPVIRRVAPEPRERRLLFAYGLIATVGTLAFIGYAIAKLGRYVTQDRLLPFAVFIGLLSVKLPRKFRRLFSGRDDESFDDDDESETAAAATPAAAAVTPAGNGSASTANGSAPAKPSRRRWWLVAAALALGACALVPVDLKVRGAFRALPRHNADVRARVDGIVGAVLVEEGQLVRPGEVIARLESLDLDAELGQVAAQIDEENARLRLLLAGPPPADVSVAEAALATAEGHLPYAHDRLQLNRSLFERGIISRQELKLSEEQAVTAEHEVAEARERVRSASAGARPDEIAATRASIRGLEIRRDALEQQRGLLVITSPTAGVVATPAQELHDLLHAHVQKGALLAEVYDDRVMAAEIEVSEQDIADVRLGQQVALRARAHPEVTFRGTVTAVAVAAQPASLGSGTSSSGVGGVAPRRMRVTTLIDNHDLLLHPEMTGQAKIVCGRRTVLSLVTRRLARTFKVEFWSWS